MKSTEDPREVSWPGHPMSRSLRPLKPVFEQKEGTVMDGCPWRSTPDLATMPLDGAQAKRIHGWSGARTCS